MRVRERVHDRGLLVAGDDDAAPAVRLQVAQRPRRCSSACASSAAGGLAALDADAGGEGAREVLDGAGAQRQPVVGTRAGDRRRALDDVEPVHRRAPVVEADAGG